MKYKIDLKLELPKEIVAAASIDEDTPFETYFEGGSLRVRMLDDDDLESLPEETNTRNPDVIPEKCAGCQNYCLHCGGCTIGNL